jgi:RNA polymerase sigma factor (TIGR02999 family)
VLLDQSQPSRELLEVLYADLRAVASNYFAQQPLGHTLQPTALVHEAVLRLLRDDQSARGRAVTHSHFLAIAATAMRQILVDHARAARALKRGGTPGGPTGARRIVHVDVTSLASPAPLLDLLELDEAIRRLAELDERAARVVVLRFFAGLTIRQVAEVVGVSDFTVENDWRAARAFLARELGERSTPGAPGAP